jgi:hypothetical protein
MSSVKDPENGDDAVEVGRRSAPALKTPTTRRSGELGGTVAGVRIGFRLKRCMVSVTKSQVFGVSAVCGVPVEFWSHQTPEKNVV